MNFFIRNFFFLTTFFFSFNSIQATTITWLGGDSAWDNPSQWDTGTVPSYGDDVIIPSGYVRIYNGDFETATSVEVQSAARLRIYGGGTLEISGAVNNDGLHNMGRVYISGNLNVNDITRTNTNISAKAIKNEENIYTYAGSSMNIKYIDDIAISNELSSYFRLRGALWLNDISDSPIYNKSRFYNSGSIDINHYGSSSPYVFINTFRFYNYSTGVVNISSDSEIGIHTTSNMRNYGDITVKYTEVGFNNLGTLTINP